MTPQTPPPQIKTKRNLAATILCVAGIVFVALAPLFTWYEPGTMIARGDIVPFLNLDETIVQNLGYTWSAEGLGEPSGTPTQAILMTAYHLLGKAGLSVGLIQALEQSLLILLSGLGMLTFARSLFGKTATGPLVASWSYLLSVFMIIRTLNIASSWTLALLPFVFAVIMKIIEGEKTKRQLFKQCITASILLAILTSIASVNIPTVVLIAIGVFILLGYLLIREERKSKIWKRGALILVISILLNTWWLVPALSQYVTPFLFHAADIGAVTDVTEWSWTHDRSTILNIFWLNGVWSWRLEYAPFLDWYANPLVIVAMFLPIITVIAASPTILKRNRERVPYVFFTSAILALIFLEKGLQEPLGKLNEILYFHLPGFFLFREPFPKFGILHAIFLAPLFGYAIETFSDAVTRSARFPKTFGTYTKYGIITFACASLLATGKPILTGEVIPDATADYPYSSHVTMPQYWNDAIDALNNRMPNERFILTPENAFYQVGYAWGFYGADAILEASLLPSTLQRKDESYITSNVTNTVMKTFYNNLSDDRLHNASMIASLLNVRYVLHRNDVSTIIPFDASGERRVPDPTDAKTILDLNTSLTDHWGELMLYDLINTPKAGTATTNTQVRYPPSELNDEDENGDVALWLRSLRSPDDEIFIDTPHQENATMWFRWGKDFHMTIPQKQEEQKEPTALTIIQPNNQHSDILLFGPTTPLQWSLDGMHWQETKEPVEEVLIIHNVKLEAGKHELLVKNEENCLEQQRSCEETTITGIGVKKHCESHESTATISERIISPTERSITVANAPTPHTLSLPMRYNPFWSATLISEHGKQTTLTQDNHIESNGFMNGWKNITEANYTLDITYTPQRYYKWGIAVSLTALALSIIVLITPARMIRTKRQS